MSALRLVQIVAALCLIGLVVQIMLLPAGRSGGFISGGGSQATRIAEARSLVGDEPVVMMSASWCGPCKSMKADLQRRNVVFVELDIDREPKASLVMSMLRARGVPTTIIGEQLMVGYDASRIPPMLDQAGVQYKR